MQRTVPFLAFCLILVGSTEAFAWWTATHSYLAKGASQGKLDSKEIYGADVPDLFELMLDSPDYDYLVNQTHYHFGKVQKEAKGTDLESCAFGFVSHNEKWGADRTAHRKGLTTPGEGYIIAQSTLLGPQLQPQIQTILVESGVDPVIASLLSGPLSVRLGHPVAETAVDLLIKRNEDPLIGQEMLQSAQERPSTVPDLLVAAYGKSIAHRMKISEEEAESFIRDAEAAFRDRIIRYGEILSKSEEEAIQDLSNEGGALIDGYLQIVTGVEVHVPPEVLTDFLHLALQQVEENYGAEIAATLSYLQQRLSRNLQNILPSASLPF